MSGCKLGSYRYSNRKCWSVSTGTTATKSDNNELGLAIPYLALHIYEVNYEVAIADSIWNLMLLLYFFISEMISRPRLLGNVYHSFVTIYHAYSDE